MSTLQQQEVLSPNDGDTGESSHDECCLCGRYWTEDQPGWPLCDSPDCPNTVCAGCAQAHHLSVSELFYCPPCAGSGMSAAATVGGAVATAVAALSSALERLPMSQATLRKILGNLLQHPEDPKFRRLRLENKSIKEYIDLEPVRRILESIGFVQTQEPRQKPTEGFPPTEQLLVLEGDVDVELVKELVDVLDGLSSKDDRGEEASTSATSAVPTATMPAATTQSTTQEEEQKAGAIVATPARQEEKEGDNPPPKKAKHEKEEG